jgi:formylglycine-generating enzyme required for sulfatase activity
VNRGGSWRSDAVYCRTAMRNFDAPEFLHYDLGFRIARSIRE